MQTLKNTQLNKLKDIFLESGVKYKDFVLEDKNISLGKIPEVPTTPHINIEYTTFQRDTAFTGSGDMTLLNYDVNFVIKPAIPITQENKTNKQYLTDSLNNFSLGYLNYLFDNYRYNPWFKINPNGQSEVMQLNNNNFLITINLQTINY